MRCRGFRYDAQYHHPAVSGACADARDSCSAAMSQIESFWDSLSSTEAESAERIMQELRHQPWAQPLIEDIRNNGGITHANKARFFELRFASALDAAGIVPQYEIAGVGEST